MVLAFFILATTAEWILFHTLRSPSFCLEGKGSANCAGTKTGWRREAVKDNRPVLKPTNEWRVLWPAAPLSLCSGGPFSIHTMCSQLAVWSLLGPSWICMSQIIGLARRLGTPTHACILQHLSGGSLINSAPTIWYRWAASSPGAACLRELQPGRICFERHSDELSPGV